MTEKTIADNMAEILNKKDQEREVTAALDPFLSRVKSTYVIKSGDNLWQIAKDHQVPLNHLLELNPQFKGKEQSIQPKQVLKIPFSPMDLAHQMQGKPLEEMITEMAKAYGIDAAAFRQSLVEESKLDPKAVNPKTQATGLGQLMPEIVKMYGIKDATDAAQNAAGAAAHMKTYMEAAKSLTPSGSEELILWNSLMMYNWGIGNFLKWYKGGKKTTPPKEARIHPAKVFKGLGKTVPPEYASFYNEYVRDLAARGS